jgi:hypothetical protein
MVHDILVRILGYFDCIDIERAFLNKLLMCGKCKWGLKIHFCYCIVKKDLLGSLAWRLAIVEFHSAPCFNSFLHRP